jgi:hypothetical protein
MVSATVSLAASGGEKKQAPASLNAAWDDLASEDQARVCRAALVLGRTPNESVDFLKRHLRAVKSDPALVKRWLAELDSEDSTVRATAQEELEYLDKYIKEDLKKALGTTKSAEARKRMQQMLDSIETQEKLAKPPEKGPGIPGKGGRSIGVSNLNGKIQVTIDGVPIDMTPQVLVPPTPLKTWVRATRAVGVLEGLGTPEALKLLQTLAQGEATAMPTIEAKAALERLGKK